MYKVGFGGCGVSGVREVDVLVRRVVSVVFTKYVEGIGYRNRVRRKQRARKIRYAAPVADPRDAIVN